ncbi:MAG: HD domain-containing phosphohydrolase [Acidimicrobiia bacterium]
MSETGSRDQVRTAEVIASLCLATDLGMGYPFEHGLKATLTTMRLCDVLGVDSDTASRAYYAALLWHVGCTTDAEIAVRFVHGSFTKSSAHSEYGSPLERVAGRLAAIPDPDAPLPMRASQFVVGLPRLARAVRSFHVAYCEVAEMLAEQLGLPPSIHGLFPLRTEYWDGFSILRRAKGDEIPLPLRIAQVGTDAAYQRLMGDDEYAMETIRSRGGRGLDPSIAKAFIANALEIFGEDDPGSVWDEVLAAEPAPRPTMEGGAIDRALSAIGAFSDLASSYLSGHASGVGGLAAEAGKRLGMSETEVTAVRRAGYLHDVGRAAVHPRIWTKVGSLTADEWEQVRLHPYHTERVFARSPFLAPLAKIACTHHERIDGSGYHRGIGAAALPPATRLLAAADAFHSKTEPRPYREALSPEKATEALATKAKQGGLDPDMVMAVAEAAGQPRPAIERPAGLTDREVEVIGLLARGMQTKQIARALDISTKTADRHIQNSYRKIGVSSRAAATLFASEHGLIN